VAMSQCHLSYVAKHNLCYLAKMTKNWCLIPKGPKSLRGDNWNFGQVPMMSIFIVIL
jgi:hypothetical protein